MSQVESRTEAREERDAAIRRAVADYVREVVLGRVVSPETWAEAHPDLLPELAIELKKVQLIGIAFQRAVAGPSARVVDPSEQPTQSFWRADISTLQVRCPYCHNSVDISGDDSLVDILCSTCGSSFSLLCDTQATPTVKKVGHFELIERLGTGGFGSVWKARDTELDRTVAIKIPRAGRLDSPDVEVSFFREARAAAQLKHPGIVSVHEVGRQDDTIYIVSDLVRGASLSEWLTAAQPTARKAAEVCAKIGDALHHAHEAGVVHRDLKPSNIMMDLEDAPHIMDFGLARRDVGEITVTIDGQTLGTPAYMSPELARGEAHQADRRSDVYSLGVILFQLLTGELPFRGHARMIMMQILRDEPPKPRTLKASIPRDLQTICLKCLEKEPSRRYATAADLAEDVRRFLRNEPIGAQPITQAGRLYRWCKRQPAIAALSASLIIALVVGVFGVTRYAIRAAEGRANSYHRIVDRVRTARMQKTEGYLARALEDLKVARWIDTPDANADVLRHEAVLSLTDFRGNQPIMIESADRSITVCSFHPQSELLAIGHQDGRIELHDPESGAVIATVRGQGKPIAAISFSEDGKRLLSVDANGHVRESVITVGRLSAEPISAAEVLQIDRAHKWFEFAPGGRYLVAHNETSAAVWDTTNRNRAILIDVPEDRRLKCVRVSPDGKWVAASANTPVAKPSDGLLLWNEAGELVRDIAIDRGHGYPKSLTFSNDSKFIAFGGEGLGVYRVPTLEQQFFSPGDAVMALAFSPGDQFLSLVQIRGTVAVWSMTTNTKLASLSHPRAANAPFGDESTLFSPDGRFLLSARAYSVRVWNLNGTGERVLPGHHGGAPTLMFTSDGRRLASGSKDATVRIWNLIAGNMEQPPLAFTGPVQSLAFSPDGNRLAVADWSPGDTSNPTLHILSGPGFSKKTPISHKLGNDEGNVINAVAFTPDGKFLAACGDGIQLWRVDDANSVSGEISLTEITHQPSRRTRYLRFSPDSSLLAWADDKDVRIWDIHAGKPLRIEAKVAYGWHGYAFVEGGLAFVGPDLNIEVWDPRSGVRQFTLGDPGDFQAPHIAASPKGDYLAGLQIADSVALWDVRAKKRLFVSRPQRSEIWSLAFDPTGTRLGVGLSDGGVSVWDLAVINSALAELDLAWMTPQD